MFICALSSYIFVCTHDVELVLLSVVDCEFVDGFVKEI